ncbi:MAG: hypothetical protein WDO19_23330 [Bacteroidota bacterium]
MKQKYRSALRLLCKKLPAAESIAGGSSQALTIGLSDFISSSVNYQLVVSRSPALELANQLIILFNILMVVQNKLYPLHFHNCIMVTWRT